MKCGGKKCIYHTGKKDPNAITCDYAWITGKTKLGQIYEQYGITNYDQRAAKILGRIKCPFYSPGDRIRQSRTELLLPGSRPGKYDWARGRALYEEGASDRAIAEELGCSVPAVFAWRKREKLPSVVGKEKIDWARGRALYEKGMSDRKIAQALGAHPESVRQWRNREGLPPNSCGGRQRKEKENDL